MVIPSISRYLSHSLVIRNCLFERNSAEYGAAIDIGTFDRRNCIGACALLDHMNLKLDSVSFIENNATIAGGAINIKPTTITTDFKVTNCSFEKCSAPAASSINIDRSEYAINIESNSNAWDFTASNSFSEILLFWGTIGYNTSISKISFTDDFGICPRGRYPKILDVDEFWAVSCESCWHGTYMISDSTFGLSDGQPLISPSSYCLSCPSRASCVDSPEIVPSVGHYLHPVSTDSRTNVTVMKSIACPSGFCELESSVGGCVETRKGFLCSECSQGYCHSLNMDCVSCNSCSAWKISLINTVTILTGLFLIFWVIVPAKDSEDHGVWKVACYFLQSISLVTTSTRSMVSSSISNLVSFRLIAAHTCWTNSSSIGVLAIQLIPPLLILLIFLQTWQVVFLLRFILSIVIRMLGRMFSFSLDGGKFVLSFDFLRSNNETNNDDETKNTYKDFFVKEDAVCNVTTGSIEDVDNDDDANKEKSRVSQLATNFAKKKYQKHELTVSVVLDGLRYGVQFISPSLEHGMPALRFLSRISMSPRFLGAATVVSLVIYRGLLTSSFSLLDCRNYDIPQADGNDSRELRLFLAANEKCYNWWQVILWVFVVGILVPFPLFVLGVQFFILAKSRCFSLIDKHVVAKNDVDDVDVDEVKDNEEEEENENESIIVERDDVDDVDTTTTPTIPSITSISKSERVILGVLRSSYRHPFKWWESVQMGRRLVLIFCATVFHGAYSRALAILVANILILTIHIAASPFRIKSVNRLETISLLVLTVLSANSVKTAVLEQIGASQNDENIGDSVWTTILEVSLITLVCLIFGIIFGFDLVVNTIVPLVKNIVSNVNNLIRISRNNSSGDDDQNSQEEMMNVDSSCCVGDDNDDNERESMMSESLDEQIIEGELFVKDSEE